ncbi:hypothetical protein [Paenibacillus sp. BK720]|uniref:hypothetical protein n=1 Tax=Paenibacillus sp. BK720 TaxID=2587092 RepID=UPI00141FBDD2|nr:hypothetical protein [Paenibacillus sp. BK720]NIK72426.1 hypothetical protein [Paenibacillus sp. BK720]
MRAGKKIGVLIILLLIMVTLVIGLYQIQKPLLPEDQALSKAIMYLDAVNRNMDLTYNTKNGAESSWLNEDTFWNQLTRDRTWTINIDGVAVDLDAYTGEFIDMVFPMDGVITRGEHPDWF